MQNLFFRNRFVFGVLMVCVMAMGVSGVVDALTLKKTSGDLVTVFPNQEFTIKFSVGDLKSPQAEEPNTSKGNPTDIRYADSDDPLTRPNVSVSRTVDTGYTDGDTHYYTVTSVPDTTTVAGLAITTNTRNWGISGTTTLPAGRSWTQGGLQDIRYAAGTQTRSNVSKSRTVDTGYTDGDTHYYTVTPAADTDTVAGLAITTNTRNWVTESAAYYNNDESVSITTSPTVTLMKGNTAVSGAMALIERHEESDRRLSSGSVTLTGSHGTATTYTITIADDTVAADIDGGAPSTPASITFTVYVVPTIDTTSTVTTTSECILMGDVDRHPISGTAGGNFSVSGHVPLVYKVEGSGRLYVGTESKAYQTLPTSSAALVYLDMKGSSNRVTVEIQGRAEVASAHYILAPVRIEITNGNHQTGAVNGRFEEPLAVKVKDAKNRAISKLRVAFSGGTTGKRFIPYPGTTVYVQSNPRNLATTADTARTIAATSSTPGPTESTAGSTIYVQTDSRGEAKTYYQLGDSDSANSAAHDVTVTACGRSATIFASEGATGSDRVANLEIVSGNPQRAAKGQNLTKPLVVIARSTAGYRIPNVVIQFRTSTGLLSRHGLTEKPIEGTEAGTVPAGTLNPDTGHQIYVITNSQGQASVNYNIGQLTVAREVVAEVRHESRDTDYSFAINRVTFNINGGGSPTPARDTSGDDDEDDEDEDEAGTITVSPSSLRGETGARVQLSVSPSTTAVTITGATFRSAGGLFVETETGSTRTLLLPNTAGPYTLTLRATGYTPIEVPVTVTAASTPAPTGPGTLTITAIGARSGNQQAIRVSASPAPSSDLVLTLSGVTNPTRLTLPAGSSSRTVSATLVNASASQIVTVDATDYTAGSITIPATTPTPTPTPPADTTGGTPSRISVSGLAAHSGTVNTQLDLPLAVRVLDVNGVGVANARVTFRVRKGQGRLSQRGNGRAIPAVTNSSGRASVPYTPLSVTSTVEAEVKGVTDTVTFTITTGSAPPATSTGAANQYKVGDRLPGTLSGTYNFSGRITINEQTFTCTSSGECVISNGLVTQGTVEVPAPAKPKPVVTTVDYKVGDRIPGNLSGTYSFSNKLTMNGETYTCTSSGECVISNGIVTQGQIQTTTTVSTTPPRRTGTRAPVVNITAAQRPPMIWVEDGAIYTLVSVDVQRFIPGVTNALNIAIGGGKVYWTEQTGESSGTINSANLDGSGVKELKSIQAVPMGIAVDVANSKLYWTNSRGRIQSANLDGSGIKNVIQNLASPQDIALAGGNVYWTHSNGGVGFVNLNGQKQVRNISNGADAAGSLVIGGGKVYWTEKTGETGGTVKSANLNGTGATELVSILAAPIGIAVDSSRSKLYWTNARGRIQSASLDGSGVTNVVEGLGSPGDIVLSNSLRTPAATTTAKTPATAGTSKYDVNGDGRVDNTDASLVSTAMGTSTAKYDVNGDGTVNFLDLLLVFDNRSDGAAGAPMIVGMKLSAVQIDRLQEQIELLIATGDRSPAAMKTLIYLQQLIALARPEQTQLFANYPNPFNPETWMPYELATDTNVKITIYNPQGVVIRTLVLGHQSAGYYTGRDRAAYWDGKNAQGEQVASGVYFYQLETDDMSLLRKMVILK